MLKLTNKQRRFAYSMAQTSSIDEAIKQSEITAELAAEWLTDPDIKAVIDHDRLAAMDTAIETRERIIARYAAIANADILDYFQPGTNYGALRPLEELTREQRLAIKKIKPTQIGFELELYDRMRANDKLCDLYGLISDNNNDESSDEKAKRIRTLLQEMENVTTGVVTH